MSTRARYAILGVGGLALAVAVGLLLALALRGLTATTTPAAGTTPSSTPATPAAAPTDSPAVAAPAPRPEAGRNECVDELGDGGIDIDSVQVERDDDLAVQFRLGEPLPAGESGLGLYVERNGGGDKGRAFQLGVAFDDGQVDEVFVRDFDRSEDYEVDRYEVRVAESIVTVVFPGSAIKRLGNDWSWYAFATASGSALDACPGPENEPELLRFER